MGLINRGEIKEKSARTEIHLTNIYISRSLNEETGVVRMGIINSGEVKEKCKKGISQLLINTTITLRCRYELQIRELKIRLAKQWTTKK